MLTPTPLADLNVSAHQIPAHHLTPNTALQHRPLLIYHAAFAPPAACTPAALEAHLARTGAVQPAWRAPMFRTSHFHSTTHEVLVVAAGARATLLFGHDDNPGAVRVRVGPGDVLVVPAGVAHRLWAVDDDDDDAAAAAAGPFTMVGSYPRDAAPWDMCYGKRGEKGVEERIRALSWFERDPIYGEEGPVLKEGKAAD